jgi:hypothetical protein
MLAAILASGADVAAARLGNRLAFAECMGIGSTVVEAAPASKGAAEILALAREIGRRMTDRLAA